MPLYSWKGVDLTGVIKYGTLFARSVNDLEALLLKQGIGLVDLRFTFTSQKITQKQKDAFLAHLAALLQAHIPVFQALTMIAATTKSNYFKLIIEDCALMLEHGIPLSEALVVHGLADDLVKTVIRAGENTGNVTVVLQKLVEHRKVMTLFRARLRSSLIMPLITVGFFLIVLLFLFIFVIPQFEHYFTAYNASIPLVTSVFLKISRFLMSVDCIWFLTVLCSLVLFFKAWMRTEFYKKLSSHVLLNIPGIGSFIVSYTQSQVLYLLGLLINQGIPLSTALGVVHVSSPLLKEEVIKIKAVTDTGVPFSQAWQKSLFRHNEIEAFIKIGEASGNLGQMLEQGGLLLKDRIYSTLHIWTVLINPLLVLLLGGLITILIFALYMPLISMASVIG